MENLERYYLIILLGLLSSCGVHQKFILSEGAGLKDTPSVAPTGDKEFLAGKLRVGDQTVDLGGLTSKPLVLLFASDTCEICLAESLAIRRSLPDPTKAPTRVGLFTAIVAVGSSDAFAWKKENKIPWPVGHDEKLELFKKWCGGGSVPCTIVQMPDRGIVLRHKGELSTAEIQKLIGPWEEK